MNVDLSDCVKAAYALDKEREALDAEIERLTELRAATCSALRQILSKSLEVANVYAMRRTYESSARRIQ